jgi:uncharacterized protein YbcV (DUF1398 family)
MFSLDQISKIHDDFGNADNLALYLRELNAIGVIKYDSFITDGHSEYFGEDDYKLVSGPIHASLTVANKIDRDKFLESLKLHKQLKTSYLKMSKSLADSGIAKWTFDTNKLTLTYYSKDDDEMLMEAIA